MKTRIILLSAILLIVTLSLMLAAPSSNFIPIENVSTNTSLSGGACGQGEEFGVDFSMSGDRGDSFIAQGTMDGISDPIGTPAPDDDDDSSCPGDSCTHNKQNADGSWPIPGKAPSGGTYDKCVWSGTGSVCNGATNFTDQKCCDFANSDGTGCACNTKVAGPDPSNNDACTCCMMLAEGANENNTQCKQAIACVIQHGATEYGGGSSCKGNAAKVGNGNTNWMTSDKCTCDRKAPDAESAGAYNQTYCECRETIAANGGNVGSYSGCQAMLTAANSANCSNMGNPTGYSTGKKIPKGCRAAGPTGCKHTFYRCP